mgnify:CR=1 FL=1
MIAYFKTKSGINIAYNKVSCLEKRPGIVFLGGFRSDMEGTKALCLEEFSKVNNYSFIRFDYSGHGQSSGQFSEGTIGQWFQQSIDVIAHLTKGPQILVGSSMGGWISLLIAKRFPELVKGLITIAAAPDFTNNNLLANFSVTQLNELEAGETHLPSEYGDPYIISKSLIYEARDHLILNEPLSISAPVRFLHGTSDKSVCVSVAQQLFEHVKGKNIELILLKDEDHRLSSDLALARIKSELKSLLESNKPN